MVKVGSVIQVKEHVRAWAGCLMIVEDVKEWGITAYMFLPGTESRMTWLRLNKGEYDYIGEAALVEGENE